MPNRNVEGGYRYGYQGEFAEKEPELGSGVNSFQLRLYDSRIGRWISPDPYGQFHSPYLAMNNNPVSFADSDGGCTTKGGRPCAFSVMGGTATDAGGNVWSGAGDIPSELHTPFSLNEITVVGTSPSLVSKIWNHPLTRVSTGDALSIGGGYAANIIFGADINAEFTWILRGRDASLIPNFTLGPALTVSDGGEITASAYVSKKYYNGTVNEINALDLGGYSSFVEAGLTPGIGGFIGADASLSPSGNPTWISIYGGISGGAEASPLTAVNLKGGVRHNTILIHSNGNIYINNPFEPSKNLVIKP